MLGQGAGADKQVLRQALNHRHQRFGHHHPAQAPAGHVEVFAEAVDADDGVVDGQRGLAVVGVVAQGQINLVHQRHPATRLHHGVDAAQLFRVNRAAGGVGGRGQQHAARFRPPGGLYLLRAELKTLLRRGGNQHRAPVSRTYKMPVARVAGVGHEHFVARVDQRQAGQLQRSRRTGGDHNAAGGHVHAEAAGVPGADARAQRGQTGGLGVLAVALGNGAQRSLLHQRRGSEIGLANVQEHHGRIGVRHAGAQLRRGLGHLHHIKRRDVLGAARDLHGLLRHSGSGVAGAVGLHFGPAQLGR